LGLSLFVILACLSRFRKTVLLLLPSYNLPILFAIFLIASSISLYSVFGGILLKAISLSLFCATAFASQSASSFPFSPTWALTQDNSIVQFALSKVDIFFLDSSTR